MCSGRRSFAQVANPSGPGASVRISVTSVPAPGLPGEGQSPDGTIELQGLAADTFRTELWQSGRIHLVPDVRLPTLGPRLKGVFRNIYAGYAVEEPTGWRLFYSAWDGIDDPHDRIYECWTDDFLDFDHRRTIVEPGEFLHTSNVVAGKRPEGGYFLLGTAADEIPGPFKSTNKPIVLTSVDGNVWNGQEIPYRAKATDLVNVEGYVKYARADLNGANALIEEPGLARFYFSDWSKPGAVHWAEGVDPFHLKYGGVALATIHAANDVQAFHVEGKTWYLMGLYKKGDVGLTASDSEHLWYSITNNPHRFENERLLLTADQPINHFIFSLGFVRRGERLLGVIYGAGDTAADNHNQLFASWLQKRVQLVAKHAFEAGNGAVYETIGALGPDRQRFRLPGNLPFDGELRVFSDDGSTLLGTTAVHLDPGRTYRIQIETTR